MRQHLPPLARETIAVVLGGLLLAAVLALLALLLSRGGHSRSGRVHSTSSKPSAAATAERARVQQEAEKRKKQEAEQHKREAEMGGWLSTIQNPNSNNINEVNSNHVTVSGQTYTHTVQLVSLNSNCTSITAPSTVSFPVPPGATRLSGKFGWAPGSNGSSATLFVSGDGTTNKPLWRHPFLNPGRPLMFKQLNTLPGTQAVVFEFVGNQCDDGTFVLAEARFTA